MYLKQLAATTDKMQNKWFLSQQRKQKQNKIKIGIFFAMFLIQYFCLHGIFDFLNHTLKLKAPGQPQSAGEESLLTHDIT